MGAGIPRGKLTVVWNAIDAAELPHASRELQDQVRAELGLPGGAPPFDRLRAGSAGGSPVLVSVGRLSPEKGHAVLLQAMPGIIARYPQAVLLVVGSGRQADRLRVLAARLGLEPSVRFLGHRSDARHIMAGADLLILPSLSEGLPNVVLEAMAMGLPVVATQVGGVAEVLAGGDAGWIIQPGDARALAGGVCAALGDDRRRDEMSVKAQELVRREFTFEKQALRFERVYESVLTSPRT